MDLDGVREAWQAALGSGGITIPGITQETNRCGISCFGSADVHKFSQRVDSILEVLKSVFQWLTFSTRVICWCSCRGWREELSTANCACAFFFYKERIRKKGVHSFYVKSSLTLKHIWLKLKTESLESFGCINTVGLYLLGALGLFCQLYFLAVHHPWCFQNLF